MLYDSNGDIAMKLGLFDWKGWNCSAYKDVTTGNFIIDEWFSPGPQPTPAEIQQASNEYDQHLIDQANQEPIDFVAIKTKLKNKLGITTQAEWKKFRKAIKWIAENKGD